MKKNIKLSAICAVILILAANPAFSQINSIEDLQDTVDSFSKTLAKSLPFYSTIGLNWSDAYIGKLINAPPHFGIGFSVGATTLKMDAIKPMMDMLGYDLPLDLAIGFPLPGYVVEARLGGIILPFDVGIKYGYLPQSNMLSDMLGGVSFKYQLIGADIRYALVDSKVLPFKLSVGLGFNHLKGGISVRLPLGQEFSFPDPTMPGNNLTLQIPDPNLGLIWDTKTLDFKTQISFKLFIITPYLGVGASYGWSKAGYQVRSAINVNGAPLSQTEIDKLKELGITGIDENGFESIIEVHGWNVRAFGGFSINMAVIKLDLTAMYNFRDKGFGATVGLRFQL